jgi:hypothetical protein
MFIFQTMFNSSDIDFTPFQLKEDEGKLKYRVLGSFKKWPPERSHDVLCGHCCHTFVTSPVPVADAYDESKFIFTVNGIFCSFQCAKRHIIDIRWPSERSRIMTLFHLMVVKGFGFCGIIDPAPPREYLKCFNGHLSIEEFRMKSDVPMEATCITKCFIPSLIVYRERHTHKEDDGTDNEVKDNQNTNSMFEKYINETKKNKKVKKKKVKLKVADMSAKKEKVVKAKSSKKKRGTKRVLSETCTLDKFIKFY